MWKRIKHWVADGRDYYRCNCGGLVIDDENIDSHLYCPRDPTGAQMYPCREISNWEFCKLTMATIRRREKQGRRLFG